MACSPEQIAAKKQQALERLRKNKETAAGVGATGFLSSPAKGTGSPIASGQFYGSPAGSSGAGILGNQKNLPGKADNKAKQQPLKDNRIFSQPYTNKRDNVIPEKKKEVVPLPFAPSANAQWCLRIDLGWQSPDLMTRSLMPLESYPRGISIEKQNSGPFT
uniref:Uncharacterized protein n=1 Tax=Lutzomyia longipalpis TaxID=7200 RepID=A0A1B0CWM3_LUTLO